jgi:hypothetical protein
MENNMDELIEPEEYTDELDDMEDDLDELDMMIIEAYKEIENFEGICVLNLERYQVFLKAKRIFEKIVSKNRGKTVSVNLTPPFCSGAMEAELSLMTIGSFDEKKDFLELMNCTAQICFTPRLDGKLIFDIVVPDVFIRVEEE